MKGSISLDLKVGFQKRLFITILQRFQALLNEHTSTQYIKLDVKPLCLK